MNSFQDPWNDRIVTVIRAGRTSGSTTLQNVRHTLAPSIRAASSSSYGTASNALFMSSIPTASQSSGRIIPAYVLNIPSSLRTTIWICARTDAEGRPEQPFRGLITWLVQAAERGDQQAFRDAPDVFDGLPDTCEADAGERDGRRVVEAHHGDVVARA